MKTITAILFLLIMAGCHPGCYHEIPEQVLSEQYLGKVVSVIPIQPRQQSITVSSSLIGKTHRPPTQQAFSRIDTTKASLHVHGIPLVINGEKATLLRKQEKITRAKIHNHPGPTVSYLCLGDGRDRCYYIKND